MVTHTHLDHAPGAAALAEATGARVVGFGPAEDFAPDERVRRGVDVALPGPFGRPHAARRCTRRGTRRITCAG